MIRVNLLPLKETERAIGRRQRMSLAGLGACVALAIMLLPFLYQGRRLSALETEIQEMNNQIQRFNAQVKEVQEMDRLKKDLTTKLRIIEELDDKRVGPAHVLADLSIATPDKLWLLNFEEKDGASTFTGMALDNETIARFMRQLQESPYFHSVDLVETTRSSRTQPNRRGVNQPDETVWYTRFIVKARIDYFGRDGKPSAAEMAEAEAAKPVKAAAKGTKP
jgi:type IV pilus assembly protein PilN